MLVNNGNVILLYFLAKMYFIGISELIKYLHKYTVMIHNHSKVIMYIKYVDEQLPVLYPIVYTSIHYRCLNVFKSIFMIKVVK